MTRSSGAERSASARASPTSHDQKYWSSMYSNDLARAMALR